MSSSMLRFLLGMFVALLIGALLAVLFHYDNGFLHIFWFGIDIQTSVIFSLIVLMIAGLSLYAMWSLLLSISGIQLWAWFRRRRALRIKNSFYNGITHYINGRWTAAETELMVRKPKRAAHPGKAEDGSRVLHYWFAAQAAHRLGNAQERDRHIEHARAACPEETGALWFLQAQFLLEQQQFEAAKTALNHAERAGMEAKQILSLRVEVLRAAAEWEMLVKILPECDRLNVLLPKTRLQIVHEAYPEALTKIATNQGVAALEIAWKDIPKKWQSETPILLSYLRNLNQHNASKTAHLLIEKTLENQFAPEILPIYGEGQETDALHQIAQIEYWQNKYGEHAVLSLLLGKLSLRLKLWGRAGEALAQSLRLQPTPEALLYLGKLYENLQEDNVALLSYQQGLRLALHQNLDQPLSA